MPVELKGATSGSVTLAAPAVAGSNTVTLPAVTGTAVVSGQNSAITAMTSQASTSGTSIDFTGIPSWVKRITVMFNGVSTNGTNDYLVQIGSGSFTATGYSSASTNASTGVATSNATTGFNINCPSTGAATVFQGIMTIVNMTGNIWVASGAYGQSDSARASYSGGSVSLSGTLDRVRITSVGGTNSFDAGSVNVMYE